jgi:hypothetical protein
VRNNGAPSGFGYVEFASRGAVDAVVAAAGSAGGGADGTGEAAAAAPAAPGAVELSGRSLRLSA